MGSIIHAIGRDGSPIRPFECSRSGPPSLRASGPLMSPPCPRVTLPTCPLAAYGRACFAAVHHASSSPAPLTIRSARATPSTAQTSHAAAPGLWRRRRRNPWSGRTGRRRTWRAGRAGRRRRDAGAPSGHAAGYPRRTSQGTPADSRPRSPDQEDSSTYP